MRALVLNLVTDVVAITVVAYGIYFRRYYRRDLLLAYFSLNVGVFAVTALLADNKAGVGLGLGLFGILSIIRLRSDSITQEEIAYYFVALALGLIAGLSVESALARPRAFGRARGRHVHRRPSSADGTKPTSDHHAGPRLSRPGKLKAALERLLGGDVRHMVVMQLDLVADTTMVDVRYKLPRSAPPPLEAVAACTRPRARPYECRARC